MLLRVVACAIQCYRAMRFLLFPFPSCSRIYFTLPVLIYISVVVHFVFRFSLRIRRCSLRRFNLWSRIAFSLMPLSFTDKVC